MAAYNADIIRSVLEACRTACRACADECGSMPRCTATASCAPKPAGGVNTPAPNSSPRWAARGAVKNDTSTVSRVARRARQKEHLGAQPAGGPGGSATAPDAGLTHPLRPGNAAGQHADPALSGDTNRSKERRACSPTGAPAGSASTNGRTTGPEFHPRVTRGQDQESSQGWKPRCLSATG